MSVPWGEVQLNGLVQRVRPTGSCLAPIPCGWVDTRSITDLRPEDIPDSGQCHFFAGIGGWGLAFRLAGIPDDAHAWSASLPCQPFSVSGSRKGEADDRHLFPVFHRLVRVKRPPIIFGEQVASADGLKWLAGVHTAMEDEGYLFGAACLPAACVGAPHKRERIFWGAVLPDSDLQHCNLHRGELRGQPSRSSNEGNGVSNCEGFGGVQYDTGGLHRLTPRDCCKDGGVSDSSIKRLQNRKGELRAIDGDYIGKAHGLLDNLSLRCTREPRWWTGSISEDGCPDADSWGDHFKTWADGTTRRTEPGLLPLAHGFPERVGLIRGFGNAIVPQVAAIFIEEFIGACREQQQ